MCISCLVTGKVKGPYSRKTNLLLVLSNPVPSLPEQRAYAVICTQVVLLMLCTEQLIF